MRTIKFRAWDKTKEEMNYKVLAGNTDLEDSNYTCNLIWVEEKKEWMNADHACIDLMQFTGLKDRHGIEIYEGDILDYHYFYFDGTGEGEKEMKVVVEYNEEFGTFGYSTEEGFYCLIHEGTHEESFEVSGNIHQNPELLPKNPFQK